MNNETQNLAMRYARLRLTAIENIKTSYEALLRDLQQYPDPEAVEHTLVQAVEFARILNKSLPDDKRIQLNQNRR
jgi:hypothetical protein